MSWNLAIAALATVTVVSLISGFLGGRTKQENYRGILNDYLLANQGLSRWSVINLLTSTSFSLNGMLYQIFLGYSIGLWALLVQGAWALSYVFLASYVERVFGANSLHDFLGKNFGKWTRILAGLCSIIGFTILIGWEFNVANSTFAGLLNLNTNETANRVLLFAIATVFASFLYTTIGGLKSNAFANIIQNLVKFGVFALLALLLWFVPKGSAQGTLLPSFSQVIANLGVFGLITNVAFSLVWQFVDMSTWHSVIASRQRLNISEAKSSLRLSGLAVFIAPGIIGTLLGAFLAGTPDVDSNNVMVKVLSVLPENPMLFFLIFAALLASIMSTIDGLLLASAYSGICDVIYRSESLEQIDGDRGRAQKLLIFIRLFLGLVAVVGTIGVFGLIQGLGVSLFDVVYFLIICQLSLTGPVFMGLVGKIGAKDYMVWSIVGALIIGFSAFVLNRITGWAWLSTGAGCFTMLTSYVIARLITTRGNSI